MSFARLSFADSPRKAFSSATVGVVPTRSR